MISTGHARALLAIDDPELQYTLANKIFDEKLSVRETEKLVKEIKNPKKPKEKKPVANSFIYQDLEEKMKQILGTKVSINAKDENKGKIEIEYYNKEDLDRLIDMILKKNKRSESDGSLIKGDRFMEREEKLKALDAALGQIEKQFGKGAVMKLGDPSAQMNVETIPTGSLSLDIALGLGGIPKGRIIEIYGPESSGKTTVALHICLLYTSDAADEL